MVGLRSTVLTAVLALLTLLAGGVAGAPPRGVSAFTAPDNSVAFAMNIANDGSNDLYFSLLAPRNLSWVGVGMGNDRMWNTLIFIMYPDVSGHNITLSPRLSYDRVEPSYSSDINITLLQGTGIENDQMQANFVCHNCFSWEGGWINQDDECAPFIFATGPNVNFTSDSVTASIPAHQNYGIFNMDLGQAWGPAGVPDLTTADMSGTTLESFSTYNNLSTVTHAGFMITALIVLMPGGFLFMPLFKNHVLHTVIQSIATLFAFCGLYSGSYSSTLYNRTSKYNTAHQILGLVVVLGVAVQFVGGFRLFRRRLWGLDSSKLISFHLFFGPALVLGGVISTILGLHLTYRTVYSGRYIGLLGVVVIAFVIVKVWMCIRQRPARRNVTDDSLDDRVFDLRLDQPAIYLTDYRSSRRAQEHMA